MKLKLVDDSVIKKPKTKLTFTFSHTSSHHQQLQYDVGSVMMALKIGA